MYNSLQKPLQALNIVVTSENSNNIGEIKLKSFGKNTVVANVNRGSLLLSLKIWCFADKRDGLSVSTWFCKSTSALEP